ncbi:unnamed protein product [Toxocara canis]|uniref:PABS domain-containing protein n=1 Tax=Toxocara canis TaxID=6265 RepID=A0A183VD50_TOXCA|nr:unnamed protein product [Toxocara canis]
MAAGRALGVFNSSKKLVQALVIGLGGASISTYLRHATENVNVTAVEIDASMVEIAKKYFGFIEDERQHCVVDDGVNFIRECVRKGEKFDVVILDACKNVIELVEAPVKAFLESNAVQLMSQVIAKDGWFAGVLLINHLAIGVGPAPYVTVQKLFGEFFEGCMHFSVPATVNKAIVCVKRHSQYKYMQSQQFQSNMHKYFDELSSNA